MNEKEWREILYKWELSKKNKQLKQKLMDKAQFRMTREEIVEIFKATKEFDLLTNEEKEAFDFEDLANTSVEDVSAAFTSYTIKWCFYIQKYEMEEDYEVCSMLRQIIDFDKRDSIRLFETYFGYVKQEDEIDMNDALENIVTEARKNVKENYNKINERI